MTANFNVAGVKSEAKLKFGYTYNRGGGEGGVTACFYNKEKNLIESKNKQGFDCDKPKPYNYVNEIVITFYTDGINGEIIKMYMDKYNKYYLPGKGTKGYVTYDYLFKDQVGNTVTISNSDRLTVTYSKSELLNNIQFQEQVDYYSKANQYFIMKSRKNNTEPSIDKL